MSALSRLFARARDEIAGLGDAIAGSHAQRIVDQEIRETDAQLHEWRAQLAHFQANRFTARERRTATIDAIAAREGQGVLALQAGNAALAREVAAAIVALEQQRESEDAQLAQVEDHIAQMQRVVGQGEDHLRRLRHQLDTIRATESIQRAQQAVARRQDGMSNVLQTALASADRLRARTQPPAQGAVHEDVLQDAFSDLDDKLRRAGILDVDLRTDAVLERIQARAHMTPRSPR
jgi:phage shock protein A